MTASAKSDTPRTLLQIVRNAVREFFAPCGWVRINRLERELTAARAEAEALRKDAERLKFQYSQYVKTCEAVGLGGVVSYEQWISAIDAARSERGKE